MQNQNPGCLGYILQILGILPKNRVENNKLPYLVRDDFLSLSELSFYKILGQVTGEKVVICPKVSLKDIFFVTESDRSLNSIYLNKISRKHVDFLLCRPHTMKLICGIELDDISHNRKDRIDRDRFVEEIFQTAGLELIRFKNKRAYTINELEKVLLKVLYFNENKEVTNTLDNSIIINSEASINKSFVKPICPRCGTPMILREAKKGDNKGNKFYGCINYPKCREIIEI
ncbi:MAG: DUF2726 domain-containing protein [Vulcanibacillus sp.]